MRSLIGSFMLVALLMPPPAAGQDSGAGNEHQPTSVRIRILRDDLDPALVAWLADNAKPQQLTADAYPSLAEMTGTEVAAKLCGYVPAAYWRSLEKRNALAAGAFNPGNPLGTRGYDLAWPACFYVERGDFSHVLMQDELASDVYFRETGSPGSARTHSNFFERSGIADLSKVSLGTTLRYSFRTRPTLVTPVGDRDTFLFELNRQAAAAKPGIGPGFKTLLASIDKDVTSVAALQQVSDNARAVVTESSVVDDVQGGEIVTAGLVGDDGISIVDRPSECGTAAVPPFDLERVVFAYKRASAVYNDALRTPVVTYVGDNGFFGAWRDDDETLRFRNMFSVDSFELSLDDKTGKIAIGPRMTMDSETLDPLNFDNGFARDTTPDAISGHGTHVTWLVLGGAAQTDPRLFAGKWLQVRMFAFSPGKRIIPRQSATQFSEALNVIGINTPSVVNLSVRYGGSVKEELLKMAERNPATLFVVAAGNAGIDLDKPENANSVYPAQLGDNLGNVLAVTAEDGSGALTAFANHGGRSIDLAAPGCTIRSTLDGVARNDLSGTSQAAPTVSFAAALLARLWVRPANLKHRLILSGDLITAMYVKQDDGSLLKIPVTAATLVPVRSRSRLNIAKAAYKDFDYLRYVKISWIGDAEQREIVELLGTLTSPSGPVCGKAYNDFARVAAFKRLGSGGPAWCFWRSEFEPYRLDATAGKITFTTKFRILPSGETIAETGFDDIALDQIDEFVRSENAVKQIR